MKAWLILILLLFTVPACGDTGRRDAQGVATGDEAQVLARRHLESGLTLHASGSFLDAIPEYDLALRIYPHYAEAYLNRRLAYAQSDQSQRAIQDFEQALRLNPNLPKAYAGWGRAFMALEQPERAIRYFDEAILLDPLDTESYLDRGMPTATWAGMTER